MNEEAKRPDETKAKEAKTLPEKAPTEEKKEPGTQKKKRKINRFTLKELEQKLKEVQEKMHGLSSSYAQELLKRKDELLAKNKIKQDLEDGGKDAASA